MYPVPDRSNHLPEDDLPSWVFDYDSCPNCEGMIDGDSEDCAEYDISVCDCTECNLCGGLASERRDEYIIIKVNKNQVGRLPSISEKHLCNTCVEKISDFI